MNSPIVNASAIDFSKLEDGHVMRVSLDLIDVLPGGNVRTARSPEEFSTLRNAIRTANGVTQSCTVRANPDDPFRVQLIAGYGRYEASSLEGFTTLPVIVKKANDKEAIAMALSENLDREALSISDEITAAQRFISHYDGDYKSAAAQLNWSVHRLRSRLLLNNCSDSVLQALRCGDIVLGHAEILSAFVPKLQDGTLQKIIDEGWSVEYLKERAGKANRWLKNAIFDKSDCSKCAHNSDFQAELFDNSVGKSKCSNLVCYNEKTVSALAVRKAELEEEYGLVLLAIEKPPADRNHVCPSKVGKQQYENGCSGCDRNAVILQDGINADSGSVSTDQCIDTDCFRSMVAVESKKQQDKDAPKAPKKPSKVSNEVTDSSPTTNSMASEQASAKQLTPGPVIESSKDQLRDVGSRILATNANLMEAIMIASLVNVSSTGSVDNVVKKFVKANEMDHISFNSLVESISQLSLSEISQLKIAAYQAYLSGSTSKDEQSLVIHALSKDDSGKEAAVKAWMPSEDVLNKFLKGGLVSICKQSGFDQFYNDLKGDGAFEKATKKKSVLVQAMLVEGFDWTSFAPDAYLACLK